MQKFFTVPFGDGGDRTPVPDAPPIDGSVSYETGYGAGYQLDPGSAVFTGHIVGLVLTIDAMYLGAVAIGSQLLGAGVTAGTTIGSFGTGTGQAGTYNININQNVSSTGMTTVTNPAAKLLDRTQENQLLWDATNAIRELQLFDAPDWITTTLNDGVAFPYAKDARVRHTYATTATTAVWKSLIDNNTSEPGSDNNKWIPYLSDLATAAALAVEVARATAAEAAETARAIAVEATLAPPGVTQAYAGAVAPNGWLECDGSSKAQATYPALYAVLGTTYGPANGGQFTLPDLRGLFVRGWSHGGTIDAGRARGTVQQDAFENHSHTYTWGNDNSPSGHPGHGGGNLSTGNTGDAGDSETRPVNIALMYIIKT